MRSIAIGQNSLKNVANKKSIMIIFDTNCEAHFRTYFQRSAHGKFSFQILRIGKR